MKALETSVEQNSLNRHIRTLSKGARLLIASFAILVMITSAMGWFIEGRWWVSLFSGQFNALWEQQTVSQTWLWVSLLPLIGLCVFAYMQLDRFFRHTSRSEFFSHDAAYCLYRAAQGYTGMVAYSLLWPLLMLLVVTGQSANIELNIAPGQLVVAITFLIIAKLYALAASIDEENKAFI
ncbi:hypothetical protein OE749_13515 [Aestuariibacter sp. AA17]|uniref:DUF2975 domain-containing protein n=1 Tax=Fluctibacter corallii TaxID=2984329 RepID=A0ABT3AAL6_9ALTE|nr:hypothetical protein [Aestuariibacter sp. AA17]MCV2885711.1 hypothetical protein [Aestuariibacter sp. AA17]